MLALSDVGDRGGGAIQPLAADLEATGAYRVVEVVLVAIGGVFAGRAHHRWRANERAIRAGRPLVLTISLPPSPSR